MDEAGTNNRVVRFLMRPRVIGLLALAGLLMIRVWDPLPVKLLRFQVFDFYQKIQPRVASDSQVIIVDIDEASLARYGQWPWPRTLVGQMVQRLIDSGVKTIGFDIVFAEPDRMSPPKLAKSLVNLDRQTKDQLQSLPDHDAILAEIFRQTNVVVSQSALSEDTPVDDALPPRKPPLIEIGNDSRPYLLSYSGLLRTIPELESAAAGAGVITLNPEPDGVVRRIPALLRVGKDIFPTLSLELFRVARKASTLSVSADFAGIRQVSISNTHIPTDHVGCFWVYFANRDLDRYVSAKDLLAGSVSSEKLADKIVLIGTSAIGLGDSKVTPIDGRLPGVEVHAQILDMIQAKAFLIRPHLALAQEQIIFVLIGLFIIFLMPLFGAVPSSLLGGCVAVGMIATSWYWFVAHRVLLDVSYGAVGLFSLYGLLSYLNYLREESSRRQIRNTFSRYVSPTLVDRLARDPGQLKLGGETKDMTVMFCDVRDFTSIAEQYRSDPQGLTQFINRLLTPLTDVILNHKGTIDKYMGDSIMAFWNAPIDDQDHAVNACRAALEMFKKLDVLNKARHREAAAGNNPFSPIKVGIGINSGQCVVGNLGSEQRFDYSVLGDSVNIASRLEGQSKIYDLGIMIGPHTADLVRNRLAILEVDLVVLKGKWKTARTYAVLGDQQLLEDSHFQRLVEPHSAMLAAYRDQRWREAQALLSNCRKSPHAPLGLYHLYEERIAHFRIHPPPTDWRGVFVSTSK